MCGSMCGEHEPQLRNKVFKASVVACDVTVAAAMNYLVSLERQT